MRWLKGRLFELELLADNHVMRFSISMMMATVNTMLLQPYSQQAIHISSE